jgi:hypothetical protein
VLKGFEVVTNRNRRPAVINYCINYVSVEIAVSTSAVKEYMYLKEVVPLIPSRCLPRTCTPMASIYSEIVTSHFTSMSTTWSGSVETVARNENCKLFPLLS